MQIVENFLLGTLAACLLTLSIFTTIEYPIVLIIPLIVVVLVGFGDLIRKIWTKYKPESNADPLDTFPY
jgi:uncharacterized membrane-anchored protein